MKHNNQIHHQYDVVVTDFCKKLATTNLIPLRWFPYIWWPVFTPGGEWMGRVFIIRWGFYITGSYR
ncbi:hypothetical protein A7T52_02210 [Salmonella enterica subsp. diarizonae serovar 60:r:e,n,x,z15]|nr:hypothetical protein A7S96_04030 [Salmonella enterica subsp. diarizonae serovar 60:r:e,n,x,z15]OHH10343.1 hypothetical protein A7R90_18070 [Salmonella enterica]OHF71799.1 hypothetical protein A7T04_00650 [Salmonella enterica subsp. diarizonae serovar 60:r:e,n,x,z15]OHF76268.1 hypothetical protein A7T09_00650 [Salmonella enterica subsp. diarizonae serovar 60:r:e,n,x,z15]OHF81092.1 hypothetical protein A7T26_02495 [Salmonella enterica subsp. diarizonae serovar 60:r:e,n,x,z15]